MDTRVVEIPQLGALILRVPLAGAIAERVDPLLGARLLFIAASAAECHVEVIVTQPVEERLRFEQPAAALGVEGDGIRPAAMAGSLRHTSSSAPTERAISSRKVSISANLNPVSMCISGNGIGAG